MKKGTPIYEPLIAGPEDNWDIPIVDQGQVSGGLKFFDTEKLMNDWAKSYPSRAEKTVAFVFSNDADGVSQAFKWDGSAFQSFELGTQDIPAPGVSFVKPDGSTITGIELMALDGLSIEGNEKDGFTLKATGGGGITFEERKTYALYKDVKDVFIGQFLELNALRNTANGPVTGVEIGVKPMSFQPRSTTGYLAYLQYPEVVIGKDKAGDTYRKGTIWMDMTAVSSNGMLQEDKPNKAIGLQDVRIGDDPNVTGGSNFLVWPFVYLEGVAPDDGYVELVWYEKETGDIATDVNGHAMAVRHNYKQGQVLTPQHDPLSFCHVINAKGIKEYGLAIVDSFDDFIRVLDYSEGPTGICIQEMTDSGVASEALIKAELDTGFNVRVESYYAGTYLASANYVATVPEPAITVTAGSFVHVSSEFEMYAVTDIEFSVAGGLIQFNASGNKICDFYGGLVVNPELTRLLAGHNITVDVSLIDKDDAWRVDFYNYSGDLSKRPPLYKSRNNESLVLESGWSKFGSGFISEDVVSGLHAQSFSATVPADADFVMVAIYPVSAQNPCDLSLKGFTLNADPAINGYEINRLNIAGLQHLDFMTEMVKLVQDTQGYAVLRYTLNDTPDGQPMPFGIPEHKMKFVHLDKSVNIVSGSAAKGGEGGIVADEPVEVTISQKWQLYNEQSSSNEAEFWLMLHKDGDGSEKEIPGSRSTFTVDSKRQGVDYFTTNEVTVQLEPGDYIYARGSASASDGAYAQTNAKQSPLCITYVKEKGLAP